MYVCMKCSARVIILLTRFGFGKKSSPNLLVWVPVTAPVRGLRNFQLTCVDCSAIIASFRAGRLCVHRSRAGSWRPNVCTVEIVVEVVSSSSSILDSVWQRFCLWHSNVKQSRTALNTRGWWHGVWFGWHNGNFDIDFQVAGWLLDVVGCLWNAFASGLAFRLVVVHPQSRSLKAKSRKWSDRKDSFKRPTEFAKTANQASRLWGIERSVLKSSKTKQDPFSIWNPIQDLKFSCWFEREAKERRRNRPTRPKSIKRDPTTSPRLDPTAWQTSHPIRSATKLIRFRPNRKVSSWFGRWRNLCWLPVHQPIAVHSCLNSKQVLLFSICCVISSPDSLVQALFLLRIKRERFSRLKLR